MQLYVSFLDEFVLASSAPSPDANAACEPRRESTPGLSCLWSLADIARRQGLAAYVATLVLRRVAFEVVLRRVAFDVGQSFASAFIKCRRPGPDK